MELLTRDEVFTKIKNKGAYFLYLYTPMCGTCQVAEKMLGVIEALDERLAIGKTDINYISELAEEATVESVPCLLFIKNGTIQSKLYAFKSVPDLLEKMKRFQQNH